MNKDIYTLNQRPWIEYLEIDEETGERKLRADTPEEIVAKYNDFINSNNNDNSLVKKTKLQREELIRIKDNFLTDRNKCGNLNIPNELYLNYLEKFEELLNNCLFENDNSFINRNISNINWISKDDAMNYLFDNIIGNISIQPFDVPQGQNLSDIFNKQNQYYKGQYICEEEKDLLLNIIIKIKNYIKIY